MANVIIKGTLLFDGAPVSWDTTNMGEEISFGDTHFRGNKVVFVAVNNLLISTRTICRNVSWDQLNKQGYIYGRPITIDGTQFLCRSLHVGMEPGASNEWDAALNAIGEDDSLWHWSAAYFWGMEQAGIGSAPNSRIVRGGKEARFFTKQYSGKMIRSVRFRPVLEYLSPAEKISRTLLKKKVKVYGPGGYITGFLKDFSDYDLVLTNAESYLETPKNLRWVCFMGPSNMVIDRSAIIWVQEG